MRIARGAGRLHDKAIGATHVLEDLKVDLPIRETLQLHHAEIEPELLANLLGKRGVGAAGEDLDAVGIHRADWFRAYRLRGGHRVPLEWRCSARLHAERYCARLKNEMGNTVVSGNDFRARYSWAGSAKIPKTAEPLPVIAAGFAPR